jgi:hypothetical protein
VTPLYLLEKISRHGASVDRLRAERTSGTGEFGEYDEIPAIAFDAADFVWSFLVLQDYAEAQESRQVRNQIAQEIVKVLESYDWLTRHRDQD